MERSLPTLLAALLRSREFREDRSEIVLNHGTAASYDARAQIEARVRMTRFGRRANLSKLVHSLGPRAYASASARSAERLAAPIRAHCTRDHCTYAYCTCTHCTIMAHSRPLSISTSDTFAASRFFAAAAVARFDVIVTIDDDVLPYSSQIFPLLSHLTCSVALEDGFPMYNQSAMAAATGLHGSQERYCDARGYQLADARRLTSRRKTRRRREWSIILTNFAAFSRTLARRLTSHFDELYGAMLTRARGNGERTTCSSRSTLSAFLLAARRE